MLGLSIQKCSSIEIQKSIKKEVKQRSKKRSKSDFLLKRTHQIQMFDKLQHLRIVYVDDEI